MAYTNRQMKFPGYGKHLVQHRIFFWTICRMKDESVPLGRCHTTFDDRSQAVLNWAKLTVGVDDDAGNGQMCLSGG